MYSVVLMAALTTGGTSPDCGPLRCWCQRHFSCSGCWGYTGCYGCAAGCWGSCYGGCYGGCYGSCYGATYVSYGCHGCYGCTGCYGYAEPPYVPVHPAPPPMPPAGASEGKKEKESARPDKAKLLVEVPEGAKLYIDDRMMKSGTSVRSFTTPELEEGQAYYYILRAEVVREGKTYEETKTVIVYAGEQVRTTFPKLETATNLAAKYELQR